MHSAEGRFSAGLAAIQLDNYCDNMSVLIGPYDDYPQYETTFNYFTSYYYGYFPKTAGSHDGSFVEQRVGNRGN